MRRVATAPFMLGSAKSITTTLGFKAAACFHGFVAVAGFAHHLRMPAHPPACAGIRLRTRL
jgi:hypothetical protein